MYIGFEVYVLVISGIMLIDNPYIFEMSRFLVGFGGGVAFTIAPPTSIEVLPSQISAKFSIGTLSWFCTGVLVSSTLGTCYHDTDQEKMDAMTTHWRLVLSQPAIISVIRFILILTIYNYETAQFYFEKYGVNDYSLQKSKEILCKIYIDEDADKAQDYLVKIYRKKSSEKSVRLLELFSEQYKRQTFAAFFVEFTIQFSGANFFVFYSNRIFTQAGLNGNFASMVFFVSGQIASLMCMYTVDKFGRKTCMVVGILIQAISFQAFTLMMYFEWFDLIYLTSVIYMMSYYMGVSGASFPWFSEILPPAGNGFLWIFSYVFLAINGKFFHYINEQFGTLPLYIFFTANCFAGVFIINWLVVETKGKSPVQIEYEYMNKKWRPLKSLIKK